MEPRDYEELYENLKSSFVIRNKEEVKKIADFLNKSDYEFYNEIREETTEEEFKYGPVRFKREINAVSIRIKRSIQASVSIIPFFLSDTGVK